MKTQKAKDYCMLTTDLQIDEVGIRDAHVPQPRLTALEAELTDQYTM